MSRNLIVISVLVFFHVFLSDIGKCNPIVISECEKFVTIFTARIIQDGENELIVIDKVIKGSVNSKMMSFAKIYERSEKLKSKKLVFMFYPKGANSYETHSIDRNGGFNFRVNENKEYCRIEDLDKGLSN